MKMTRFSVILLTVGLAASFSHADDLKVPDVLELFSQGSGARVPSGKITWGLDAFTPITADNGYEFTCYCYMNGNRVPVMIAEEAKDLKDADAQCKSLEGGLYEDYGVNNRTGRRVYTIVRSCAGAASRK